MDGVKSLTARLARLRLSVDLAPFTGVSFGVSGGAAASSRARALVDRRGSDILRTVPMLVGLHDERPRIVLWRVSLEVTHATATATRKSTRRTSTNQVKGTIATLLLRFEHSSLHAHSS